MSVSMTVESETLVEDNGNAESRGESVMEDVQKQRSTPEPQKLEQTQQTQTEAQNSGGRQSRSRSPHQQHKAANAVPAQLCSTQAAHRQWAHQMRAFIFDIDGVIHNNQVPVPGAATALDALRKAGKKVMFMTNNAGKRPEDIIDLFSKLGVQACTDEVVTSSIAAADYLKSRGLQGQRVYVVGMNALSDVVQQRAGVVPFGAEAEAQKSREDAVNDWNKGMEPPAKEVAAVVAGVDLRFNYYKLCKAANYLRQNRACLFVATNPDPRAPLCSGAISPAAGSMIAAIATASGRQPDIVCGKPSESLARHLLTSGNMDPSTTCMVGDRTDTDMEFGRSVGMQTLFVESGTMTLQEANSAEPRQRPNFTAPSIAVLNEFFT